MGSGLVNQVGDILTKNGFAGRILLGCDKNTLKASSGIVESLSGFFVEYKVYDDLRVATMENVNEIEGLLQGKEIAVLSVGSGSINDICRLVDRQDKKLCIFATVLFKIVEKEYVS